MLLFFFCNAPKQFKILKINDKECTSVKNKQTKKTQDQLKIKANQNTRLWLVSFPQLLYAK